MPAAPGKFALERLEDRVAAYLSTRLLASFGENLLISAPSAYEEREMLRRARELVLLLEGRLRGKRPDVKNLIDLARRRSLRAVRAALGVPPRSPPPAAQSVVGA